ncbi:MAG: nucleoside-diphosphate kinase [Rhizobiaceae bacterium]
MSHDEAFQLTTKDHAILDVMRERAMGRDPIACEILRRKLSRATLMFGEDVAPTVVTLSSRVQFRVDDAPAETRIISPDNMRGLVGQCLPISSHRALALIGLSEGQSMTIPKSDGGEETITAVQVVYQPEAARRERLGLALPPEPTAVRRPAPILRLVHDADGPRESGQGVQPMVVDCGFDDPGPSAA